MTVARSAKAQSDLPPLSWNNDIGDLPVFPTFEELDMGGMFLSATAFNQNSGRPYRPSP